MASSEERPSKMVGLKIFLQSRNLASMKTVNSFIPYSVCQKLSLWLFDIWSEILRLGFILLDLRRFGSFPNGHACDHFRHCQLLFVETKSCSQTCSNRFGDNTSASMKSEIEKPAKLFCKVLLLKRRHMRFRKQGINLFYITVLHESVRSV
jgi:hypothetical protein